MKFDFFFHEQSDKATLDIKKFKQIFNKTGLRIKAEMKTQIVGCCFFSYYSAAAALKQFGGKVLKKCRPPWLADGENFRF